MDTRIAALAVGLVALGGMFAATYVNSVHEKQRAAVKFEQFYGKSEPFADKIENSLRDYRNGG